MKCHRMIFSMLLTVCFGREALALDDPPATGAAPERWNLAFSDDFDREEIGTAWTVVDGNWEIREGNLRGNGQILSARGFTGAGQDRRSRLHDIEYPAASSMSFLRLEFDVETDPVVGETPDTVEAGDVSEMSFVIHAEPPERGRAIWRTGYGMQFGGEGKPVHRIRRAGVELAADVDPEIRIKAGKVYRVIVENDRGHLRMFVDGALVLEHREEGSILGEGFDRVGFYFFTRMRIHRVRVYVQPLPDGLI